MKALGNEGVLELQQPMLKILERVLRSAPNPGGLGVAEVQGRRLGLKPGEIALRGIVALTLGQGLAPAIDLLSEAAQGPMEPGASEGRGQVTDQRCRPPALRESAFGRVVRGIEVKVGEGSEEPFRPARSGEPHLLAGHKFQGPMGAKVKHRMGRHLLPEVAVKGGEGVRGREAALEEQAHGIAFVAEAGLNQYGDVAEVRPKHKELCAIGELLSRSGSPGRLKGLKVGLLLHVAVHGNGRKHVGVRAVARSVALQHGATQSVRIFRCVDGIARALHAGQRVGQGTPHRKVRRRAHGAALGRKIKEHDPHAALRPRRAPQRRKGRHPISEARHALLDGLHVRFPVAALWSASEDRRSRRAVELGDGHHDGGLHRSETLSTPLPLIDGLELQGVGR